MTDKQTRIEEIVSSKIAADEAESGWVIAYMMVQTLPVFKAIASHLEAINQGIASEEAGRSVGVELHSIFRVLEELKKELRR